MATRLNFCCAILFAVSLALPSGSQAHRSHFGWTDIRERDGVLQIEHRFHEHDVVRLLTRLGETESDVTSTRNQARFALYVEQHFSLQVNSKSVELELVGAELSGAYVFVYQQLTVSEAITGMTFTADPLMELYDDQLHLVNIVIADRNATLEFSKQSKSQTFNLD